MMVETEEIVAEIVAEEKIVYQVDPKITTEEAEDVEEVEDAEEVILAEILKQF